MSIPEWIRRWESEEGVELFRSIGVREGSVVVDFGFGHGHFAVAAARAAGESGHVLALDCDPNSIEALTKRVAEEGLANIDVADTGGGVVIPLGYKSADFVLCYDLLHHPGFSVSGLLKEACRVLKTSGVLSVVPFHMSGEAVDKLEASILAAGFISSSLLHEIAPHFGMLYSAYQKDASAEFDSVEKGDVYNYLRPFMKDFAVMNLDEILCELNTEFDDPANEKDGNYCLELVLQKARAIHLRNPVVLVNALKVWINDDVKFYFGLLVAEKLTLHSLYPDLLKLRNRIKKSHHYLLPDIDRVLMKLK